jgi:hypothetical protein
MPTTCPASLKMGALLRNAQPAFADGGGAFTLQHFFVVAADQRCPTRSAKTE